MSTLKKAIHWLGLGPDEEYPAMGGVPGPPPQVGPYGVVPDGPGPTPNQVVPMGAPPPTDAAVTHLGAPPNMAEPDASGVRTLGPIDATQAEPRLTPLTATPDSAGSGSNPRIGPFGAPPSGGGSNRVNTVRPIPAGSMASTKPVILTPRTFNDAQEIGDKFRSGKPVVMDLQGIERELARRLIDFASGACYALKGHMDKVADKVYLLIPDDVEISPEDRIELREKGLYDG